jgi:hypothetical protein
MEVQFLSKPTHKRALQIVAVLKTLPLSKICQEDTEASVMTYQPQQGKVLMSVPNNVPN